MSSARPRSSKTPRLPLAISAAAAALTGIGIGTGGGGQPAPPSVLAAGPAAPHIVIPARWPVDRGPTGPAPPGRLAAGSWLTALEGTGTPAGAALAGSASRSWIPALAGTATPARQAGAARLGTPGAKPSSGSGPRPARPAHARPAHASRAHSKPATAATEGSGRPRHRAAPSQQHRQSPNPCPGSGLQQWICHAEQALIQHGTPRSQWSTQAAYIVVEHESSGNPRAYNGWDSNAAAGHPSEGIAQVIGPTFQAYALPGHTDIWNPVDNMIAAFRYAISRYGSMNNIPGVVAVRQGGSYVGY
ncbi:MAG: transglycosylase SLT domain-containing protein [Streptosporangiales bacterium]